MKAVVLGASGYTGMVLLRILGDHERISHIYAVSSSKPGAAITESDPGIHGPVASKTGNRYVSIDEVATKDIDVVFSALPHLTSATVLEPFFRRAPIIDLSADFRIQDDEAFRAAYGEEPPREDLRSSAVYGLSEVYREDIAGADLIANPGCYPTCSLLPLIPLVREGLVAPPFVVNALSGISGAGKKAKLDLLYSERTENANAYSPGHSHRHWQEIREQLDRAGATGLDSLMFTPHLIPISQGMIVTTYVTLAGTVQDKDIADCYRDFYASSPFVRVQEALPEARYVRWSNRCDIAFRRIGDQLQLFSSIDNLVKGAAGQAVQNMNIRFGFNESTGLRSSGEF